MSKEQQQQLNSIERAVGQLQGLVEAGFQGVHERQDIANGRTKKLEESQGAMEKKIAFIEGKAVAYGSIAGLAGSLLVAFISSKF